MEEDKIRKGQKAFNDLYQVDPDIANLIRGTINDPFYNDKRLPDFYKKIEELKNKQ